jgi:putative flippase GtrA
MRLLSKFDIRSALITGLTTGVVLWRVMLFLGHATIMGVPTGLFALIVPVLWLAGVQLGYFLGMWMQGFIQFGRFVAIGFANAAVDFGVLYLLIAATGLAAGIAYSAFKTISFSVATFHSYYWNKHWTFESSRSRDGKEFLSFLFVAVGSLLVNVAIASAVLGLRPDGITPASWAGIAAIAGSGVALIFSFLGFRMFVFKR